ncbi:MAG: hypothetical protein CMI29_10075 [Opitutae bacterium]|nr:hypothetical protein [Opitutae bacterium]
MPTFDADTTKEPDKPVIKLMPVMVLTGAQNNGHLHDRLTQHPGQCGGTWVHESWHHWSVKGAQCAECRASYSRAGAGNGDSEGARDGEREGASDGDSEGDADEDQDEDHVEDHDEDHVEDHDEDTVEDQDEDTVEAHDEETVTADDTGSDAESTTHPGANGEGDGVADGGGTGRLLKPSRRTRQQRRTIPATITKYSVARARGRACSSLHSRATGTLTGGRTTALIYVRQQTILFVALFATLYFGIGGRPFVHFGFALGGRFLLQNPLLEVANDVHSSQLVQFVQDPGLLRHGSRPDLAPRYHRFLGLLEEILDAGGNAGAGGCVVGGPVLPFEATGVGFGCRVQLFCHVDFFEFEFEPAVALHFGVGPELGHFDRVWDRDVEVPDVPSVGELALGLGRDGRREVEQLLEGGLELLARLPAAQFPVDGAHADLGLDLAAELLELQVALKVLLGQGGDLKERRHRVQDRNEHREHPDHQGHVALGTFAHDLDQGGLRGTGGSCQQRDDDGRDGDARVDAVVVRVLDPVQDGAGDAPLGQVLEEGFLRAVPGRVRRNHL